MRSSKKPYSHQQEAIIKAIDYINHNTPAKAVVNDSCICKDHDSFFEPDYPAVFPEGYVSFANRGHVPVKGDIFLDKPSSVNFKLSDFHKYFSHEGSSIKYAAHITQIIHASSDWELFDFSPNLIDSYVDIFSVKKDLIKASVDFNHWYNAVHVTPDYSEEEQKEDPIKKYIMDTEKELTERPKKIILAAADKINSFYLALTNDGHRDMPQNYHFYNNEDLFPEVTPKMILKTKLNFIQNSYNTLKAKNIFFPDDKVSKAIVSIDEIFEGAAEITKTSPY